MTTIGSLRDILIKNVTQRKVVLDTLPQTIQEDVLRYKYFERRATWYFIPFEYSNVPGEHEAYGTLTRSADLDSRIIEVQAIIADMEEQELFMVNPGTINAQVARRSVILSPEEKIKIRDLILDIIRHVEFVRRFAYGAYTEIISFFRNPLSAPTFTGITDEGLIQKFRHVVNFYNHLWEHSPHGWHVGLGNADTNVPIPQGYKFTEQEYLETKGLRVGISPELPIIREHDIRKYDAREYITPEHISNVLQGRISPSRGDVVYYEVADKYFIFEGTKGAGSTIRGVNYVRCDIEPVEEVGGPELGITSVDYIQVNGIPIGAIPEGFVVIDEFPINYWQKDDSFYRVLSYNIQMNELFVNDLTTNEYYVLDYIHNVEEGIPIQYVIVVRKSPDDTGNLSEDLQYLLLDKLVYNRPPNMNDPLVLGYYSEITNDDNHPEVPQIPEFIMNIWKASKDNFLLFTYRDEELQDY